MTGVDIDLLEQLERILLDYECLSKPAGDATPADEGADEAGHAAGRRSGSAAGLSQAALIKHFGPMKQQVQRHGATSRTRSPLLKTGRC
jgi:hypothetical protein